VLVLIEDDKLRRQAVDSLRRIGIDTVAAATTAQARAVLRETRPSVLVTGYDVPPDDLAAFRHEVFGVEDRCPTVDITRELPSFHLSGFDRFERPKVWRDQVAAELPPTVLFELVKAG
jgi:hypothetical protein